MAIRRLAQLGYLGDAALTFWQNLWQSQGESFFWKFLGDEEKAAAEYRHWYPRLKHFASECRRTAPTPTVTSFSKNELEQHRVLAEKMQAFAGSESRGCIF